MNKYCQEKLCTLSENRFPNDYNATSLLPMDEQFVQLNILYFKNKVAFLQTFDFIGLYCFMRKNGDIV